MRNAFTLRKKRVSSIGRQALGRKQQIQAAFGLWSVSTLGNYYAMVPINIYNWRTEQPNCDQFAE